MGSNRGVWASCMPTSLWRLLGQQRNWDCSPALPGTVSSALSHYLCRLVSFLKLLFLIDSVVFQEEGSLSACVKPVTSNQKHVRDFLIESSYIPDVCPDILPLLPKTTATSHPHILTCSSPPTGPLHMHLPLLFPAAPGSVFAACCSMLNVCLPSSL